MQHETNAERERKIKSATTKEHQDGKDNTDRQMENENNSGGRTGGDCGRIRNAFAMPWRTPDKTLPQYSKSPSPAIRLYIAAGWWGASGNTRENPVILYILFTFHFTSDRACYWAEKQRTTRYDESDDASLSRRCIFRWKYRRYPRDDAREICLLENRTEVSVIYFEKTTTLREITRTRRIRIYD